MSLVSINTFNSFFKSSQNSYIILQPLLTTINSLTLKYNFLSITNVSVTPPPTTSFTFAIDSINNLVKINGLSPNTFYTINIVTTLNNYNVNGKTFDAIINSFQNIGTIYCATQLKWAYGSNIFNVDIWKNGSLFVSNYIDSNYGLFFDMDLLENTSYTYNLYLKDDSLNVLATITFTTPTKPALPLPTSASSSVKLLTFGSFASMATNYNGSYLLCGSINNSSNVNLPTTITYSTNYGSTFTNVNLSTINSFTTMYQCNGICMNWTGSFMYILILTRVQNPSEWRCYYSFNSGSTWTYSAVSGLSNVLSGTNDNFSSAALCSVNQSIKCNHIGNRIIIVKNRGSILAMSNDYGINYTVIYNDLFPNAGNYSPCLYVLPDFSKIIYHTSGITTGTYFVHGNSTDYGININWIKYQNSLKSPTIGNQHIDTLGYNLVNNNVYLTASWSNRIYYSNFDNPTTWSSVAVGKTTGSILYDPSLNNFIPTNFTNSNISGGNATGFQLYNGMSSLNMGVFMAGGFALYNANPGGNLLIYSTDSFSTCRWRIYNDGAVLVSQDGGKVYYVKGINGNNDFMRYI